MPEVSYKPPPLRRRPDGRCADCREDLAGPVTRCLGCLLEMHPECAMYKIPDGVQPFCERCFFERNTEKFLREAKGNGEYFKERAPRKKRRGRLPWW
jgi:hypothetical protein